MRGVFGSRGAAASGMEGPADAKTERARTLVTFGVLVNFRMSDRWGWGCCFLQTISVPAAIYRMLLF